MKKMILTMISRTVIYLLGNLMIMIDFFNNDNVTHENSMNITIEQPDKHDVMKCRVFWVVFFLLDT